MSVSLANGASIAINQPIEFEFDRAIDLDSVNLASTVSIVGDSASPNIDYVPPVNGIFFLKTGTGGRVLVFQPNCPSDLSNQNGGLIPSDALGSVVYTVSILDVSRGTGAVIRSASGESLRNGITFQFSTYSSARPFLDMVPTPPAVTNLNEIPSSLGLNLFSSPNSPIEIQLDQPIHASRLADDWFQLQYEDPSSPGDLIALPGTLSIAENCNESGGAKLLLTTQGILPPGEQLFLVQGEVQGYGDNDVAQSHLVLKTIGVSSAASPQLDMLLEEFDDDEGQDVLTPLGFPQAEWGDGVLQAASPFAGNNVTQDIEIGFGTGNGHDVTIDTIQSTLRATDGSILSITEGNIFCRNFTLKRDTTGGSRHGRLSGIGPNPLRIIASGAVLFEKDTSVFVDGVDFDGITTVATGNIVEPGASGRCSGGDGGDGSPVAIGSSAAGGSGFGAFQAPAQGGKGGHSGYGAAPGTFTNAPFTLPACVNGGTGPADTCPVMQVKGAGGGGGSFVNFEFDGALAGPFCYGRFPGFFATNCACPCGTTWPGCVNPSATSLVFGADLNECGPPRLPSGDLASTGEQTPCSGAQPSTNTLGESGTNGPTGLGNDNFAFGTEVQALIYSAANRSPGPLGGAAGSRVFVDGDPGNDFMGTKILSGGEVITGELLVVQGGQGGGGGGDAIGSPSFPPPSSYNTINDFKGAAGGGGAGAFHVQAIGRITVNGLISASGGDGGNGELAFCSYPVGGGSGAGSGGMLVLESLTGVTLGATTADLPQLRVRGGDRGFGVSLKNSIVINGTNYNEKCNMNLACVSGLPANTIWGNFCCTQGNANGNGNQGLPGKSKRTLAKSVGGAGGAGLIQIGVPLHEDGSLKSGSLLSLVLNAATVTGPFDLATLPCLGDPDSDDCYDGAIGVFRFADGAGTTLYNTKPHFNSDPHITQPSFGPISKVLSNWNYIGAVSPQFQFGGTDSNGRIDLNSVEMVLASSSGGAFLEAPGQVRLENSALYALASSNPKALICDVFIPEVGASRFPVIHAELVSGPGFGVRLYTAESTETISSIGSWQLVRRYYDFGSGGESSALQSNSFVKIEFQGANETYAGSGVVDRSSIAPSPTSYVSDPSDLDGMKLIRYQVTFNLLETGVPDASLMDRNRPWLRMLKIPFQF